MKKALHILSYGIATIGLAFAAIFQIGVFDNYLLDNGIKLVNNELNYDSWQYWTYKHNGKKTYTQGRPAGKHVYKASQRIRKEAKKIIEKRVGEVLSKL